MTSNLSALVLRTVEREAQEHALAQAVVAVVRAMVAQAFPCTAESHAAAKLRRPSHLEYVGTTEDEDGVVGLVWLHCRRCESTLGVPKAEVVASVGPRLSVVRP